jgi:hypothetical protein
MWFNVDDGFNDSPELMSVPARYRLPAHGLWSAIGVWMSKHGEHFISLTVVRKLGGTQLLVSHLVASGLLDEATRGGTEGLAYTGRSCRVKAPDDVRKARAATTERVRKHRANHQNGVDLQGKAPVTPLQEPERERYPGYGYGEGLVTHHLPSQELSLPKPGTSLASVDDETFELATSERGLSEPVKVGASRLVATVIGRNRVSDADRTILRIKASELLASESEEDVAECLRVWLGKTELGAHGLPLCMAEVYKRKHNGHELHGADKKAADWQALKKGPSD